jgi:ppGpp synthetase/RelA/SpoT-type nucleotidyltranferase
MYQAELPQMESAKETVVALLQAVVNDGGSSASVSARVKTPRSYLGKILNPGKATGTWPFIDDLIGGRVAFDSMREMKVALSTLRTRSEFSTVKVEVKRGAETALYYPGVHIIATLANDTFSDGQEIRCEIQLRTKAQDAWSSVSHKLAYKAGIPISRHAKRKVWRLVALMEVFDDEIDELLAQRSRRKEYRLVNVLGILEEFFADLTGGITSGPARLDLLQLLLVNYSEQEQKDFQRLLSTFVSANRPGLASAYSMLDSRRPDFDPFADWLALQPESLLVMEGAINRPTQVADIVRSSALEEPSRAIFHALGVGWPDDE